MIDPVALKAVVKALVLPPTGLLLLSIAGLALAKRLPRLGHALAWTGVLALLVLSLPVVSGLLLETLDREPPFTVERASGAQAIVILGGGTRRNAPDYGGDTLGRLTLERVRYGANVARLTGLPVMVTGGSVLGGEPEARLMREALQREFAIPVRWVEDRSRTTHENAMRSAEILRAENVHKIVIVAHSFDMPRVLAEFKAAGVDCVPAPTGMRTRRPATAMDFLPTIDGLLGSYYALYELLANLVLRVTPRD